MNSSITLRNCLLRTKLMAASALLAVVFASTASQAQPVKYEIDSEHSSVSFQIRHLVSKLRGVFGKFSGTLMIDERHPKSSTVDMSIDVSSIDTKSKKRDTHLLSAEFFDSAKFPTMTLSNARVTSGRRLRKSRGSRFHLDGDLTIKGVTKRVRFEAEYLGSATDPWKNEFASFSAKTTINRKEFGLKWNKVVESGTLLVGERVEIEINIAAKKVDPNATPTAKPAAPATKPAAPTVSTIATPQSSASTATNAVKSGVQAVQKAAPATTP